MNEFAFANLDWDEIASKEWGLGNWSGRSQCTVAEFDRVSKGCDEKSFSKSVVQWIQEYNVSTILDVGAGPGCIAKELVSKKKQVHCVEPNALRVQDLRAAGLAFDQEKWLDWPDYGRMFDLVLSCRSLGVSCWDGRTYRLRESLDKMSRISRGIVMVIVPGVEMFPQEVREEVEICQNYPYLLHVGMLTSMGYFPRVRFLDYTQKSQYENIEHCINSDFGSVMPDKISYLRSWLENTGHQSSNGFERNRNFRVPVVDWSVQERCKMK